MPNASNPFNVVSAALLFFCGFMTAPLGIIGTFSDTGEIRWVFIMMAVAGLMLMWGGVQSFRSWQRATREEEAHQDALYASLRVAPPAGRAPVPAPGEASAPAAEPMARGVAAPDGDPAPWSAAAPAVPAYAQAPADPGAKVLAHWTYAPEEWRAYTEREYRYRRREALWVGLGVAVLGIFLLMAFRSASFVESLQISGFIGLVVGGGRFLMAKHAHDANAGVGSGEVIISPWAVLLNGRYHVLQDGRFYFGGVRYVADETPPLLEFTVKWDTRSGTTNDQVRVPVPRGREDEARALAESFPRELERALDAHDAPEAGARAGSPA